MMLVDLFKHPNYLLLLKYTFSEDSGDLLMYMSNAFQQTVPVCMGLQGVKKRQ